VRIAEKRIRARTVANATPTAAVALASIIAAGRRIPPPLMLVIVVVVPLTVKDTGSDQIAG